jgi:hypothetical protein
MNITTLLTAIIGLSALLSLPALWPRFQVERPGPVTMIMDGERLEDEARIKGLTTLELLHQYRKQGIEGIALYEETVASLVEQGRFVFQGGSTLSLLNPSAGFKQGWFYLGATPEQGVERLANLWTIPTQTLQFGGRTWLGSPINFSSLPAGYDTALVGQLKAQNYYLAYRPYNHPQRKLEGQLVPPEADSVIFIGSEVLGWKNRTEQALTVLGGKPMGMVEGPQPKGFIAFSKKLPIVRVFSLKPEWQDKLRPQEVADKFVLAARERGHQLLYLRPFEDDQDTTALLSRIRSGMESAGVPFGNAAPKTFSSSPLRLVALVGIMAGLGLLALGLPSPWGIPLTTLLFLFALGYARSDAGPLLAAMVFPALGFLQRRQGMNLWLAAVLYALAGAVFLAALGSRPATVLGLEPFKGVSLTLLVPPLLVALSFIPQKIRPWVAHLWAHPIKLGEAALVGLGLGLLVVVVLRRGNDAPAVPEWELKLRSVLQDLMVRPRFKEIFAHALAPIALLFPWPLWIKNAMLVMVAVGIGSILNTFSHYHTPLSISTFRVLNGIVAGLILGFVGLWVLRRLQRWWSGDSESQAQPKLRDAKDF